MNLIFKNIQVYVEWSEDYAMKFNSKEQFIIKETGTRIICEKLNDTIDSNMNNCTFKPRRIEKILLENSFVFINSNSFLHDINVSVQDKSTLYFMNFQSNGLVIGSSKNSKIILKHAKILNLNSFCSNDSIIIYFNCAIANLFSITRTKSLAAFYNCNIDSNKVISWHESGTVFYKCRCQIQILKSNGLIENYDWNYFQTNDSNQLNYAFGRKLQLDLLMY
jgi:hypothetical protein